MGSVCLLSDGGRPSVSCVTHYSFVRSFAAQKVCLEIYNELSFLMSVASASGPIARVFVEELEGRNWIKP